MNRYTKSGTETREPLTFKIEPSFRRLIRSVAETTDRTPSEVVRDIVIGHFRNEPMTQEAKAS